MCKVLSELFHRKAVFTYMLAVAAAIALANPAQKGLDYCQAELLPAVQQFKAGKSFLVGIRFKIKPDWHIYWHNPGDSGQEVRVKWGLPKGWKVGEIMWPRPEILFDTGLTTYVYYRQPILLARITPSSNKGTVTAHLNWLVCKDVCLPAKQVLTIKLPSGANEQKSHNAPIIEKTAAQVPKKANPGVVQAVLTSKEVVIRLRLPDPKSYNAFSFMAWDNDLVKNQVEVAPTVDGETITLRLPKSEYFRRGVTRLRGILTGQTPSDVPAPPSLVYEIDVPLKRTSGEKP